LHEVFPFSLVRNRVSHAFSFTYQFLTLCQGYYATRPIKTAFLKGDSFARILELTYDRLPPDEQKITIKLEIDTLPPDGSSYETAFLTYPHLYVSFWSLPCSSY